MSDDDHETLCRVEMELSQEKPPRYRQNQPVQVLFQGVWTDATVLEDGPYYTGKHVRVYVPGPARGAYDMTTDRVRAR